MNDDNFKKLNDKFFNLLCGVYSDYYLWLNIKNNFKDNSEFSKFLDYKYGEFFIPILIALQDKFIIGVANLLDGVKENKENKVVSIFELIEFLDKNNKEEILNNLSNDFLETKKKIFKWRNKFFAHKDYKLGIKGYEDFIKKEKLEFNEIYRIMQDLAIIYDKINNYKYNTKKLSIFDSLDKNTGFQCLINDVNFFVPFNEEERILLLTKKFEEEKNNI